MSTPVRSALPPIRTFVLAALATASVVGTGFDPAPAIAQITVFDPGNYSQNVLTAARTLQQINNQIQSLQHEATMLINQAKNLTTISFPELQAITATLQQIDRLMGQAQGSQFRVTGLDQRFRALFPNSFNPAAANGQLALDAKARLDNSVTAFKQTMTVQAQIAEAVQADGQTLDGIVARSQGANGALQAAQATNQLLALAAKQQFQIENLMTAQSRAVVIEQARQAQAESDARGATTKFLGSGSAYTPQ